MKTLFFTLCMCVGLLSAQEYPFQVDGKLADVPDSTVLNLMLYTPSTGSTIDTVIVENGEIHISGTLDEPYPQRLGLRNFGPEGPIGGLEFWIEAEDKPVRISGKGIYMALWDAKSAGREQKALYAFQAPYRRLKVTLDSLSHVRNGLVQALVYGPREEGTDEDYYLGKMKAVDQYYDSVKAFLTPVQFAQIQAEPNSYTAIRELYYIAKYHAEEVGGKTVIADLYKRIGKPYSESLYAEGIATYLAEIEVPAEGEQMVDVVAQDLEGNPHSLMALREEGKYLLLDFWSLGCGPCILAAPELRAMQAKYPDQLKIIGFNVDTKQEWWAEATERDSITWTNLSDMKGTFGGAAVTYGVQGLPTYVLIDPEGKVALRFFGFGDGVFERKIGPFLEE